MPSTVLEMDCINCGKLFTCARASAKTCSPKCRQQWCRMWKKARQEREAEHARKLANPHPVPMESLPESQL